MRSVEQLAYVPRKVAVVAAPKITRLLRQQFRNGTDPYGRAWRPLRPATVAKGRRPPPLTETGDLRDGTKAKVARAGIRLSVRSPYGVYHQTGFVNARTGRHVAPRRILPQFGLPAAWTSVLREASRHAFRSAIQKTGGG